VGLRLGKAGWAARRHRAESAGSGTTGTACVSTRRSIERQRPEWIRRTENARSCVHPAAYDREVPTQMPTHPDAISSNRRWREFMLYFHQRIGPAAIHSYGWSSAFCFRGFGHTLLRLLR
jgi:hypothetical protein